MKPKTVLIHFVEGNISQKFEWDPDTDLPSFISEVAQKLGLSERVNDYGLILERQGSGSEEWLVEGSKLSDFNIPRNVKKKTKKMSFIYSFFFVSIGEFKVLSQTHFSFNHLSRWNKRISQRQQFTVDFGYY